MSSDVAADLAPTGALRASINLGNPILAAGTLDAPSGITVDIAREIGARLGLPVTLLPFEHARQSFAAIGEGRADLCFLAIEPVRAKEVEFSPPYAIIEGVFAVPSNSPIKTVEDVDKPGVQIAVNEGSAYHLYLARTLKHAKCITTATDPGDLFRTQKLDVLAGVRASVKAFLDSNPDLRLIPERFMAIQQAVGTSKTKKPETVKFLHELVQELRQSGFIAEAIARAGMTSQVVVE